MPKMFTAENMHKIKASFPLELPFPIKTMHYYAFWNTSTFMLTATLKKFK